MPTPRDSGNLTVQALIKDVDKAHESWNEAVYGPNDVMDEICQRLQNGDESAENAVICHAIGEEMVGWNCCDRCETMSLFLASAKPSRVDSLAHALTASTKAARRSALS